MEMENSSETDTSETNLVIITKRDRLKLFCIVYWRILVIIITPLILIPVAFIQDTNNGNAYLSFYIFLVNAVYILSDAMHPAVEALVPMALSTFITMNSRNLADETYIRHGIMTTLCIMMFITAIEHSNIHRRVALKILLVFGCSHYRLSCLLFFFCMFLSLWVSTTMACGLMMPVVKAVLVELEKWKKLEDTNMPTELINIFKYWYGNQVNCVKWAGVFSEPYKLECGVRQGGLSSPTLFNLYINALIVELSSTHVGCHVDSTCVNNLSYADDMVLLSASVCGLSGYLHPRPTDYTVFYFLGITYSATIGGMATLVGSHTNIILKETCEKIFPLAPKIEYPHFLLFTLPWILLMEVILYMWMNFYFLGMFRAQSQIALEIGLTEEEALYIHTLLTTQYKQLGKVKFHEIIVSTVVVLSVILQATKGLSKSYLSVTSHVEICVILLFLAPANYDFLKFFKKHIDMTEEAPLPSSHGKGCLNWTLVRNNIMWRVLFIIGGGCTVFYMMKATKMSDELEGFLLLFEEWPAPALALVVMLLCKTLTEFGTNAAVVHTVLPNVARLSVSCKVNPLYLLLAATLASSLPFHLVTGAAANALVATYVHIPPWKMMQVGLGPSLIGLVVIWFMVTLWSKAVWIDINEYPQWADYNNFNKSL